MSVQVPEGTKYGRISCDCYGCDASVVVPYRFAVPEWMRKWFFLHPQDTGLWLTETYYHPDGSVEWVEDYCSPECALETCWHLPPEFLRPIARMK